MIIRVCWLMKAKLTTQISRSLTRSGIPGHNHQLKESRFLFLLLFAHTVGEQRCFKALPLSSCFQPRTGWNRLRPGFSFSVFRPVARRVKFGLCTRPIQHLIGCSGTYVTLCHRPGGAVNQTQLPSLCV